MTDMPQKERVLLVDDDQELGQMLSDFLATDRLNVTVCKTGEEGVDAFAAEDFDLLILDIMLPGMSGLDVLQKVRQRSQVPVIMLTARGTASSDSNLAPTTTFPNHSIHANFSRESRQFFGAPNHGKVTSGAGSLVVLNSIPEPIAPPLTVNNCASPAVNSPGQVVSKEQLSERALGRRLLPYDRSIDTHISNLRGKLERAGNKNETIQNQRGVGYLLIPGE
jgi:two-component system response regulator CpxR